MVEPGKKKRVVACAFDWSGWDRSGKTEEARSGCWPRTDRATRRWRRWPASPTSSTRRASDRRRAARGHRHDRLLRRLGPTGRAGADQMTRPNANGRSPCSGPPGRTSMTSPRASRPSCGRVRGAADASGTRSSATSTAPRSRSSRRRSGCARPSSPAGPRRAARPPRGVLRGDPRDQRPRGPGRVVVDGPVPDPALRLAHARPRVGDGGPGPVLRTE